MHLRGIAVGLSLFCGAICGCVTAFCLANITRSESTAALDETRRFAYYWHTTVGSALGPCESLTNSLATLPIFEAPQDYGAYKDRLQSVTPATSDLGGASASRPLRHRGIRDVGHVFHGLPLADARGKPLLRSQRRLAADLLKALPNSVSVAELDSLGRFVFVEPYKYQLALEKFDVGSSVFFGQIRNRSGQWTVHSAFDGSGEHLLSYASPIVRGGTVDGYLVVSLDYERLVAGLKERLQPPHRVLGITSVGATSSAKLLEIDVPSRRDVSSFQKLLARLPRALSSLLIPEPVSSADRRAQQFQCIVRLDTRAPGVLECIGPAPGTSMNLSSAVTAELALTDHSGTTLGSFIIVCIFTSVSVYFSVNLFGRLWWQVSSEQERSSGDLKSALDNAAHDFRAIVQRLGTELRLLKALKSLDPLTDIVGRLGRTIRQFDLMTDDFRASILSKITSEAPHAKVELFLPFVVRHVVADHTSLRSPEEIAIRTTCEPCSASCFVMANVAQINRVLGNLIDNAVEACRDTPGKDVLIELSREGSSALIRVSDSGVGIDPRDTQSIFEPTFSTKKGKDRGKGLTSCRQVMEDLGGTVEVEKTQGGVGATFAVTLPIVPRPSWFRDRIIVNARDVLVFIDDEEEMQEVWKDRMQDRFDTVQAVVDGEEVRPTLVFISEPTELRSISNEIIGRGTQFFVDFRLKNYHVDGLSLIKEYGLQSKAVLVTNHFHDPVILERAVELGVPVLPKEFLSELSFDLEIGGENAVRAALSDRR